MPAAFRLAAFRLGRYSRDRGREPWNDPKWRGITAGKALEGQAAYLGHTSVRPPAEAGGGPCPL